MAKRYFASKRSKEPNLNKIIISLVLLLGLAYGAYRFAGWFKSDFMGNQILAAAPDLLDESRQMLERGDIAGAREHLGGLIEHVEDPAFAPRALALMADIEQAGGNPGQSLAFLERAVKEYPNSPEYPKLATRYARLLEEQGRADEALPLYKEVRDNAPPELGAGAVMGLAREAERNKDLLRARDLYRQALKDAPKDSAAWNEALDALGELNVTLAFSPTETPESKYYEIASGDSITAIGNKLNTTQGLLIRANGIENPALIRPGQRLKYTPKDFRIVIERSTCRIFLLDKDGIFKRYYTGLGMPGHETTLGRYTIGNKEKDPVWHKPGSEPIPAGDPRNELGTRWMPMVPAEEALPTDLGIHGTIEPESIGKYVSHGCPRLRKEDVEELYDLVVRATPVDVVETMSFEESG